MRFTPSARAALPSILDQGVNGVSNSLLVFSVAVSSSPHDFSGFALAYAALILASGAAQAMFTEPFITARASDTSVGVPLGGAVLTGSTVAAFAALLSLLLSQGSILAMVLLVAAFMPMLVMQDVSRGLMFRERRGWQAFFADGLWLGLQGAAFLFMYLYGWATSLSLVLAWCIAGLVSAVFGCLTLRARPLPRKALSYLWNERAVSGRFASEYMLGQASNQLVVYVATAFAGLQAAGALRGAQSILGPLNVLVNAARIGALPLLVAAGSRTPRAVRANVLRVTAGLGAAVGLVGALILAIASYIGPKLLGETWESASPLVLPIYIQTVFLAAVSGALLGLRAHRAARASLRARVRTSLAYVAFGTVGAVVAGAPGVAWGLAIATALSVLDWWWCFIQTSRSAVAHAD